MMDSPPDARRRAAAHVLLGPGEQISADVQAIPDEVEHHLRRVMRLRDGETVSITDGAGAWRIARAIVAGSLLTLEISGEAEFEDRSAPFTIASAIPKGDRVDLLVQKTTELGADTVMLLHTEHSATRWKAERTAQQISRLQRIADEATRQSRRVWRTAVTGPHDAVDVLGTMAIAEPGGLAVSGHEAAIAVGPEGGWSRDEILMAASCVTMSANILRVETAAISATALRMAVGH